MIKLIKKLLGNEIIRYGIAGGTVTLTNACGYLILLWCGLHYTVANVISLVVSKTVGYFLNKFFVYQTKTESVGETLAELFRFVLARGFTGVVDFVGLVIMVDVFNADEKISKIVVMLLVIVLNYVIGKKAVFKKKGE